MERAPPHDCILNVVLSAASSWLTWLRIRGIALRRKVIGGSPSKDRVSECLRGALFFFLLLKKKEFFIANLSIRFCQADLDPSCARAAIVLVEADWRYPHKSIDDHVLYNMSRSAFRNTSCCLFVSR